MDEKDSPLIFRPASTIIFEKIQTQWAVLGNLGITGELGKHLNQFILRYSTCSQRWDIKEGVL
jgi:hypothetical protein